MGSLTKVKIGKEDFEIQYNANAPETFNRTSSTGGTLSVTKIPDMWTYGGALRPAALYLRGSRWNDVKAYGAIGDGTTDDTVAIQDCIDNSDGIVFFPPGIYSISSTITLKTNTEYFGSRGGTMPSGFEHPQAGYGSALKWVGAAAGLMVECKGCFSTVWDGIDLDGVLYTDDVTGIYHHSNNAPTSQRCSFRNFSAYNLGYAMKIGNNALGTHYQTDGWTVENFNFYLCNYGIKINSQNGSQYSKISSGFIGCYHMGINLNNASANMKISNIAFAGCGNAAAGAGYIVIGTLAGGVLDIDTITGEPNTGAETGWRDIVFTAVSSPYPVTVRNSAIASGIVTVVGTSTKITSIGNTYNTGVYEDAGITLVNDNTFVSINDTYQTVDDHVHETGVNNYVTYINPYYSAGIFGAQVFKQTYNALPVLQAMNTGSIKVGYNGAASPTGSVQLVDNVAATTVLNADVTALSMVFLMPLTAEAAAQVGSATSVYISAKNAGVSFVITHPNNADGNKWFNYLVLN